MIRSDDDQCTFILVDAISLVRVSVARVGVFIVKVDFTEVYGLRRKISFSKEAT